MWRVVTSPSAGERRPRRCRIADVDMDAWAPAAVRHRRARPRAAGRPGARLGHAARRRAGDRQVHAAAPGARRPGQRRPALPLRHGRGVGPAGAPAGRAARHAASEPVARVRHRAAARARPRRGRRARRRRHRLDPDRLRARRCRRRRGRWPRCGSAPTGWCASRRTAAWPRCSSATSPRTARWPGPACSSTSSTPCSRSRASAHHALRLLRAVKHRFGSTDELGLFEMTGRGPRRRARSRRRCSSPTAARASPGSVVAPVLDGHRPLLVEVQALVAKSHIPTPRRSAQGLDSGRLALVLAVLQQHVRRGVPRARRPHGGGRRRQGHRARRRPRAGARPRVGPVRRGAVATTSSPAARSASAASCARSTRRPAASPRRPASASAAPSCPPAPRRRRPASRCCGRPRCERRHGRLAGDADGASTSTSRAHAPS